MITFFIYIINPVRRNKLKRLDCTSLCIKIPDLSCMIEHPIISTIIFLYLSILYIQQRTLSEFKRF